MMSVSPLELLYAPLDHLCRMWRRCETAECMSGRVGRGIPGDVWMRLYERARRYPDVIGFTSCMTSVYQVRSDVVNAEDDARSNIFLVVPWET